MSKLPTDILHKIRNAVADPRIRVELDREYDAVRFVWEAGDYGLGQLGFMPALPLFLTRNSIPAWFLKRPGKISIRPAYREIKSSCWNRRLYEDRLQRVESDNATEALRLAHEISAAYLALLGAATAVVLVRRREGLTYGGLRGLWARATGYIVGDDPPPDSHPSPTNDDWLQTTDQDVKPLADRYPDFADAVTRSVRMALDARTRLLNQSVLVRAREVVVAEFLHALSVGETNPPPLNSFWTWPWSEPSVDDAFLGVVAMRLFKNNSAHLARYPPGLFSNRPDFEFEHAATDATIRDPVNLLVLKPEHAADGASMVPVMQSLEPVWQLYAGGQLKPVTYGTVLGQLKVAMGRGPADVAHGLGKEDALFLRAALARYFKTSPNLMSVKDVAPLAAIVAVAFENRKGRLLRPKKE